MNSHRRIKIRLGEILKERKMKESELARLTGLYASYINSIAHNRHPHINLTKLCIIADALNIQDIQTLIQFEER